MFGVVWTDHEHATIPAPNDLTFTPRRWDWHVFGGPREASITVEGAGQSLVDLLKMLRYGVTIYNEYADPVWWGYLHEVEITIDGVTYRSTLDDVANRVAIFYSYRAADGSSASGITDDSDDADSQARFGILQRRGSAGDTDQTAAEQLRDRILSRAAWPLLTPDISAGDDGATLHCRGWWATLDWQLYANPTGRIENDADNKGSNLLGYSVSSSDIAFTGDNYMHSTLGELGELEAGTKFTISGTSSNNGVRTVDDAATGVGQTYTATTISFEISDDIKDSAQRLGGIDTDTVIDVSGTTSNDGDHFVDGAGDAHIQVDTTYNTTIANESAGTSFTITWGHKLKMSAAGNQENLGAATIDAHGVHVIQKFTNNTGSAFTAARVALQLQAVNGPDDDLTVTLHDDNSGAIGTQIDSGTIDSADIPSTLGWVWCDLSNTDTLADGTVYWLKVVRGDSANDTDWYRIGITTGNQYADGEAQLSDGSTYYTHADSADLLFRVHGSEDTMTQALTMLQEADQFFAASDSQLSSSTDTNQYREGDRTARAEIEDLLALGTAAGGDIIATVNRQRHATLHAAPSSAERGARLGPGGVLLDGRGQPLPPGKCLTGVWLDLPAMTAKADGLQIYSPLYVEACEYDAGSGRTRPTTRGASDSWSILDD